MTNRAAFHRGRHSGKAILARGKDSITLDNGDGSKTTVVTQAPLHAGAGPFGAADEIDTTWQTTTGAWDYEITAADFHVFARNTFNVGNIFQFTDPRSGEWVQFDPQSLNWVDENTSRQQIAIKLPVPGVVSDYTLNFPAAWGVGRHFKYEATATRLNKLITIDNAAALPPVTLQGTTIHLELEFTLATSSGVEVYIDGQLWTKRNNQRVTTGNRVEFRDAATGQQILWSLDAPRAWDSGISDDNRLNRIEGQMEFRRQGGPSNLFVTVRIPKTWIDGATYPLLIDPTTVYSDAAGDGTVQRAATDNTWDPAHDTATGTAATPNDGALSVKCEKFAKYNIYRIFLPFNTGSIDSGDTITAATVNVYVWGKSDDDNDAQAYITLVQTKQNAVTTLATGDYDECGESSASGWSNAFQTDIIEGIDSGERKDITSVSTSAYLTFTLNSTGRGWVARSGETKPTGGPAAGYTLIGLREGHDMEDNAIASGNNVSGIDIYLSERTGTSQDPYIEITHSAGGTEAVKDAIGGGIIPFAR